MFLLPSVSCAFVFWETRGAPLLHSARVSSGALAIITVAGTITLERVVVSGPPTAGSAKLLAVSIVPILAWLVLMSEKPGQSALVLSMVVAAVEVGLGILGGLVVGLVGSIAEPGYKGGPGGFLVLIPAGCYAMIAVKAMRSAHRLSNEQLDQASRNGAR